MQNRSTYPGGIAGLLDQMEERRAPLGFAEGEALPALDADLETLTRIQVPPVKQDPLRATPLASSNHRKLLELRAELAGLSELAVLHGLLVAHLRKRSQPAHAASLFLRLWTEQGRHLMAELNPRWQVSAITTFGDHGDTSVQRQVGSALSVLFGTMKLYETERRYSGLAADQPHALGQMVRAPLPLQMDPFALAQGGLDVNMLGRLWHQAEADAVIRPLAQGLIEQLIHDPRTVFRRLRDMRRSRLLGKEPVRAEATPPLATTLPENIAPVPTRLPGRPRAASSSWGVVCTTDADLRDCAAWAAHYLDLGARHLDLYLDVPRPEVLARLGAHPQITITTCDAAYWAAVGKARPAAHQLRQVHNATRSLRASALDFLAHFDIDEFLISPKPVARALAQCPIDAAVARVRPVELLAPQTGAPRHFKRGVRHAGQPRSALETLFPTFGLSLSSGLVSHTSGKVFARTGIPETRLGIHRLNHRGAEATNRAELPRMSLAHLHCRDVADFLDRIRFRLERGSYRKTEEKQDSMRLADLLTFLQNAEGDAGLRAFFEEVCTARPELLKALEARGMLLTHDLALDDKIARHFGALPITPDTRVGA